MKKGFYVSLAVGVIAVAAVGAIATQNTKSQEQPEHLAQIEEQETQPTKVSQTEEALENEAEQKTDTNTELTTEEVTKAERSTGLMSEQTSEVGEATKAVEETALEEATEAEISQVMSGADSVKNLSFKEEDGLIWPVMGDVLLKYSMEKSVYFKTLEQYKVNPAMIIAAKEGDEVLSAGKCLVTDISENEETGITLTATLGDGYEVVYGQLKDVRAQLGATIEKGSVIGTIAAPTKYYVAEGENLYFQVLQDGTPIDPLLLLE